MIATILLSLVTLLVTFFAHSYYKALKLKGNTPGPTIYPVINTDYILWKKDRTKMFEDLFKKYGNIFFIMTSSGIPVLHTTNPDIAQYVISDQLKFVNFKRMLPYERKKASGGGIFSPFFSALKLFGNGIFISDDQAWEIQRLHAKPLFKKDNIHAMTPIFVQNSQIVLDLLGNVKKGETIDIQNLFMRYTLDSFGKIAFGIDLKSLDPNIDFPKYFDKAQSMLFQFSKFFLNPIIYKKQYQEILDHIDKFVYGVIEKKKIEGNLEEKSDLISRFLALQDVNGKPFPDKWIRDIILNFIIAGRDTTATLLMWTFYLLSKNPSELKKAQQEVNSLNGKKPTIENMQPLKYLDYILKESMRLRAPVPGTSRVAAVPDVLPDGTKISTGVRVKYWSYFMHRDPKYWDDPEKFMPERWVNPKILHHSYQYLPFHGGPMSCLGRNMATLEAKVLMIMILQRFELHCVEGYPYTPFVGIITNCVGGAPMNVIPINN